MKICVCSKSFSKNEILRRELSDIYDNVKFNDEAKSLNGDELVAFLKGCDRAIIGLEKIDENILRELPNLKVISKYGVGLDGIDLAAIKKYQVRLGWQGGVNKRSVAELTLAFIIMMLRKLPFANQQVISSAWGQVIGTQLSGKTIGIIGCGHVGKDLVNLLRPFDCVILAYDIQNYEDFYKCNNIRPVGLSTLFSEADVVTIHLPLDNSTRNLLTPELLDLMSLHSILINTSRGGLVDESYLKRMLLKGKIAGAAFDVFATEPPEDQELLTLPNFFATPHLGGSSVEAILSMGRSAILGLESNSLVQI